MKDKKVGVEGQRKDFLEKLPNEARAVYSEGTKLSVPSLLKKKTVINNCLGNRVAFASFLEPPLELTY